MRSTHVGCGSLAVVSLLSAASFGWAAPAVEAVRCKQAPAIDGRLDEAVWKDAKPVTSFIVQDTNNPARLQTTAYVLYDDSNLYFGFKCDEPNVKDIVSKEIAHDGNVFVADCIEIMIDPRQDRTNYFHIAVNVANSTFDRSCKQGGFVGDVRWESRIRCASFIGDNFWSCEVAVPFYALGLTPEVGSTWGINLCREKKQPAQENSSIADLGAFNIAGRFGTLKGLAVDFSRYCYQVGAAQADTRVKDGKLEVALSAPVKNLTGKPQEVLLDSILTDPLRNPYVSTSKVSLGIGQETTVRFEPVLVTERGEYQCALRVAAADTKRTLNLSQSPLPLNFVPMAIRMVEPWYRDCIFETQKLEKVIANIEIRLDDKQLAASTLTASVLKKDTKEPLASVTVAKPQAINRVEFDNAKLPYGDLTLVARLSDTRGKPLEEVSYPLRKLPCLKGEAWMGRDRVWRVDGKPFFINAAWNYLADRNEYYNAFTGYSSETCKNVVTLWVPENLRKEFCKDKISDELVQYLRKAVATAMKDPNLLMYYLDDEPECSGFSPKGLKAGYDICREMDPYHPVFISNDSIEGLRNYTECAEINGLHLYPAILRDKPINDLGRVVSAMDNYQDFYRQGICRQSVAFLAQGFNYGDYNAVNQRVPNYIELRDQYILSLILGSTALMQFNRMVEHYPELRIGFPHLTKELLYLGTTAIIAPDSKLLVKVNHAKGRSLLKDANGELYLFVCNADMAPRDLTITVPGLNRDGKPMHVISEGRTVTPKNDAFTDRFDTFEVHVYTTSAQKPDLLTVKEICAQIDQANAARRKPGNLLFQMLEGDGVVVRVSSNYAAKYGRADGGLWHLVDGVVDTIDHYKCLAWRPTEPVQLPAWVEIQMPQAHPVGRVVVYPFDKSLKEYAVQVWADGAWKEVDKGTGKKEGMITHSFAPVTTDRIRLWITAANGATPAITEIEAYEK